MQTNKKCSTCKKERPLAEFYPDRTRNSVSRRCKQCEKCRARGRDRKEYARRYYQEHEKIISARQKKYFKVNKSRILRDVWIRGLRTKYGLSKESYQNMLDSQGRVCAICGKKDRKRKRLCVDHDHKTGRIRGLLCSMCNRILGMANDDAKFLKTATDYLIKEIDDDNRQKETQS